MYKGKQIIGKSIITLDTGEIIDAVQDVLFDSQTNKILGFLVDEGGILKSARVLPFENVKTIGEDGITIVDRSMIVSGNEVKNLQKDVANNNILIGTRVMTEDGKNLGKISDVYFDEMTGTIEGYEVTGGLFADAMSGTSFLPSPKTINIGRDVAFVPSDVITLTESQVGGLRKVFQNTGERLRTGAQSVQSTVSSRYQNMRERVSGATAAQSIDQTEGKTIKDFVHANNGTIIAAPGQIVTAQIIQAVRESHREQELLDAVDMTPTDAMRSRTGTAYESTRARVREGAQTTGAQASDLWMRIKEKATHMREKMNQEREQNQIKSALGRPVTRVILDEKDNVILKTGDIVTHEAVEKARHSNVLDVLVGSVYKDDPQFTSGELKERGSKDNYSKDGGY